MSTQVVKLDSTPIILSRGIFDLLKAHIRTRKLSKYNEAKLELELKYANQVLRSELPENIVDIDTRVRVKEIATGNEFTYHFVAPNKARKKAQYHFHFITDCSSNAGLPTRRGNSVGNA